MGNIYIEIDNNFRVTKIHRMPFDPNNGMGYSREELEKKGFFVNTIPDPVNKTGKRAVAMYNPDTKSIYYEYVNIPMSDKHRIELMENALNTMIQNGMYGIDSNSGEIIDTFKSNDQENEIKQTDTNDEDTIAEYMAYQIISGNLVYEECIAACPMYEEKIKKILADNGIQV